MLRRIPAPKLTDSYSMRRLELSVRAALLAARLARPRTRRQTSDPLQALKDTLSPDDRASILQEVLGKERGTGQEDRSEARNARDRAAARPTNRHQQKEEIKDAATAASASGGRRSRTACRRHRDDRDELRSMRYAANAVGSGTANPVTIPSRLTGHAEQRQQHQCVNGLIARTTSAA